MPHTYKSFYANLSACLLRLAGCPSGTWNGLRLGLLRRWCHGRVPIENASTAVAGKQLPFAQIIPNLRPHAHPAPRALLILRPGQSCTSGGGNAIETCEPLSLDQRPQSLPLGSEALKPPLIVLLALSHAFPGLFERSGKAFYFGPCAGELAFFCLSALQAGKFLIFQSVGFRRLKLDFVLNGRSLGR